MIPNDPIPDRAPEATPAERARVLLVDDHPANLLALEAILEPLGQELVKATSGEEALKFLLQRDFAAILMDVQMPGMDGFQTASLIKQRERTRTIPIIFLTALSRDTAHIFKGYAHGAVDYLLKPFDPEILRSKVSVFVDLFLKEQQLQRQAALLRQNELEALERRSELRYRRLLDSLPESMWAARADGTLYYANQAWRDYTGHTEPELSLEVFLLQVHPEDQESMRRTWEGAVSSGHRTEREFRMRRQDGEWRWHLGSAVPERDEAGRLVGFIAVATDIDDKKRVEDALRLASEAKDAFLAAASHELRTPLAAAKGHAHLAMLKLGGQTDSGPGKSLKIINRQIDRMTKLVEELLDISRLQAGRLSLELERFDLCALARETCDRMAVLSQVHTLRLETPEVLEGVWDRGRLDQVLTNLLSNALRYSPEGGEVRVRLVEEAAGVHLEVRDHGVGIPAEKQALIFERFGRAHGSRYGGLGLGLTISQGIVEQHSGRIWVESTGVRGEGSTFHVWLPRETTTTGAAGVNASPPPQVSAV